MVNSHPDFINHPKVMNGVWASDQNVHMCYGSEKADTEDEA